MKAYAELTFIFALYFWISENHQIAAHIKTVEPIKLVGQMPIKAPSQINKNVGEVRDTGFFVGIRHYLNSNLGITVVKGCEKDPGEALAWLPEIMKNVSVRVHDVLETDFKGIKRRGILGIQRP